jgi:hypothetical protein
MSTSITPERQAPESPAIAAPGAGIVPAPEAPRSIAEAANAARAMLAEAQRIGAPVASPIDAPVGPGDEPVVDPLAPFEAAPIDVAAPELDADGNEIPADNPLVVTIPGREAGEEIEIEAADLETAERLRQLNNGFARGEEARAIREEAQAIREEAEDIRYGAQLDPAGVILSALKQPADLDHVARFLLTQPGALERLAPWIGELMDEPDRIPQANALMEAERIRRRQYVEGEVNRERELNNNARQLVRTTHKSIESLAPEGMDDRGKQQLADDVLADVQQYARAQKLERVDPRAVPGLVQRRLSMYGLAPRRAGAPGRDPKAPTVPNRPAAGGSGRTPAALLAGSAARRSAVSAPPGAGSPVAMPTAAPKYDPTKPGSPIKQAADFARTMVRAIGKRPTT